MNIFNIFKKCINNNIIKQCIEYYEDNDIFLKMDNNYNFYKEQLLSNNKIPYIEVQNFFTKTRGSNFSFFRKYYPFLYKSFNNKYEYLGIEHTFPLENTICVKLNFQDFSQDKKLKELLNKNIDKKYLIIDLRGCLGGNVKICASLCNVLLPECEIFTQKFKNKIVTYMSDNKYYKFEKIFIFIDNYTASSSEILAYSIYNKLNNVSLIGFRTYGKTCGQNIITNKKYGFILSVVSFSWQIKNFSYKNLEILNPSNNDYIAEVQKQIKNYKEL